MKYSVKKPLICVIMVLFIGSNFSQGISLKIHETSIVVDLNNEIMNSIESKNVQLKKSLSNCPYDLPKLDRGIRGINKTYNDCEGSKIPVDMNAQLFSTYEIIDFGGQAAWGLTSADFNNDGNIDFAVAYADRPFTHSTISIFYNNGNLEFTQEDVFTFSYSFIDSLVSGDFDGDGDIDLLFTYSEFNSQLIYIYGVISILFNDGYNNFGNRTMIVRQGSGIPYDPEGRFAPHITSSDFDSDGDLDFLVGDNSGKVELYLNNGSGNFTSAGVIYDWGLCSWGVTSADYDNDGDMDFLVAAALNSTPDWGYVYLKRNQFLESNGTTIFEPGSGEILTDIYNVPGTESLVSLDYEENGKMDFVAGNFFELFLYLNKPGGYDSFKLCRIPMNSDDQPEDLTFGSLASGDFDNDGYDDFVVGGVQGVVRLFINNHGLAAITRPCPSRLYIFNKEYESPITEDKIVVIGRITINVKGITDLLKVEFYDGNMLRKIDTTYPYNWTWRVGGSLLQKSIIRIVAYDFTGRSSVAEIKVWKLF
jgi:hypothetical protein